MKLIPSSLLSFNKRKETWLWPSCKNPKTLSFRVASGDIIFKTVNSVFFDPKYSQPEAETLTTPDSYFTNSSESASISTESEEYLNTNEYGSSLETIVRGARSERLFFEPGPVTSSILEGNKQCAHAEIGGDGGGGGGGGDESGGDGGIPYKESVAMAIESDDPHGDFKKSMEEMVERHGLKEWECLEELLGWYLRMNGKNHHELIVGAFVDLLAGISGGGSSGGGYGGTDGGGGGSSCDHSTISFTSVASTFTSPISSPLSKGGGEKIIEEEKIIINH
ncbi:transcription repressor OFP13 [Cynara cardunculus var. scolymus]|uniref:Transcription repressor n=1 Tax=Cynara cardunculus var. scolymus TaxID=59895 RepID=A0A118K4E5_CYNCS|nr:transcription repressor OFP13 [Cynara cardunculus var. scolymus]KVI07428.1 Ovate protein family, C-terminal [Cynara cardunculus var. scolymus]